MRVIIKRGNDQIVTMLGLRTTSQPPIYLNAATVKATLQDNKGAVVPPFQDVPMNYVAGSNGNYEWVIDSVHTMIPKGQEYALILTAKQDELDYRTVHAVSVVDA